METLSFEVTDGIARISSSRPEAGNPIDERFFAELVDVTTAIETDEAVRAVLITAEGKYFSIGGNLADLRESPEALQHFIRRGGSDFITAIAKLHRMRAPVVVAVHALAVGGLVPLIAACDIVLAGRSASFYAAYPALGLSPDGGATYFLPRLVGDRRARAFYLRNQTWTAEQAYEYGLVSEVVEDDELRAHAEAVAAELAAGPTCAFGEIKNLLAVSHAATLETHLEHELRATSRTGRTADALNAIESVAAKQRPVFEGR